MKTLFYCEKYVRNTFAIFDVRSIEDIDNWQRRLHIDINLGDERTLIFVDGFAAYSYKGPREGQWYELPDALWTTFEFGDYDLDDNGRSPIFRLRATLTGEIVDVQQYYYPESNIDDVDFYAGRVSHNIDLSLNLSIGNGLQLIAHGIGHGNWNEVTDGKTRLFYDTGTDAAWNETQVRETVAKIGIASSVGNVHILLSHWDIDHYQGILGMTDADLSRVSSFTAPSQFPGTRTAQRVLDHISAFVIPVLVPPTEHKGRDIGLVSIGTYGPVEIFRATKGRSRNQTGMVLVVHGSTRKALLTGDHHYQKLMKYVFPTLTSVDQLVLVIPHHGGHAGHWNPSLWRQFNVIGILSCAPSNRYGHPKQSVAMIRRAHINYVCTCGSRSISLIL